MNTAMIGRLCSTILAPCAVFHVHSGVELAVYAIQTGFQDIIWLWRWRDQWRGLFQRAGLGRRRWGRLRSATGLLVLGRLRRIPLAVQLHKNIAV